jgi:hypothetical protein
MDLLPESFGSLLVFDEEEMGTDIVMIDTNRKRLMVS